MAQYTLDGSKKKIELIGLYASIKNNSAAAVYVSQQAEVDPNGENVTPIQAGESVSIPTNADKCIYLLGSGKVAIISSNSWQNFFKSAPALGGGGSGGGGITQQQLEETLQLYETKASASEALSKKVNAVEGKGLSSNDYTDEDKNKLEGLKNYDDSDIKADITALNANKADKTGNVATADKIKTSLIQPVAGKNWFKIAEGAMYNSANTITAKIFDESILNNHNDIFGTLQIIFGASNGALLKAEIRWTSFSGDINFNDFVLVYYKDSTNRFHCAVYVNVTATRAFSLMPFYNNTALLFWVLDDQGSEDIPPEYTNRVVSSPYTNTYTLNQISNLQAYIGYTDSDIYGLEADFENSKFTRIAGAVGKDFDSVNAFGGRRRCNVTNAGTVIAYYGDLNYEDDGYNDHEGIQCQTMVEQPKFYYKVVPLKIEKGVDGYKLRKARYYVSDTPKAGFKLHPAFIKNGIELDKVYLSAYEGSLHHISGQTIEGHWICNDEQVADFNVDFLDSRPKAVPISGRTQALTRANARKLAHNVGDGWDISIVQTISATQLLFLIEYGTFNSQTAIGNGVVNKTEGTGNEAEKTGATSSLGNASGSVTNTNGYNIVSYRGEENFWGNVWAWVDGMNEENPATFASGDVGTLYVADHAFVDDSKASPYKNTGIHPDQGSGYISAFGYSEEYDWLFIPAEHTGNSALPVGDRFWNSNSGWRVALLSGRWSNGADAGTFCWTLNAASSDRNRDVGARLIYRPTPTQGVS